MFRIACECDEVVRMKTVTTRIPENEKRILEDIQKQEGIPQAELLRRIIRKGIDEKRKDKAIKLLKEGSVSIRNAAEIAGVNYIEMLEYASEEGVEIGYTIEDLEEDFKRV